MFDIKQALVTALKFYVGVSVVGFVVGFFFRPSSAGLPTSVWIIGIVAAVAIMYYFAVQHFDRAVGGLANGVMLGITAVAVTVIIDALGMKLWDKTIDNYYNNPLFWVNVALTIGTAALVGMQNPKKSITR